jgi:hypothetical protein
MCGTIICKKKVFLFGNNFLSQLVLHENDYRSEIMKQVRPLPPLAAGGAFVSSENDYHVSINSPV